MGSSRETALITGASTGIGAVYADRLAKRGYDLILVARNGQRMEALAERLRSETGQAVRVLAADLTDRDDLATIEQAFEADDSITLLVNNAGMSLDGSILENDAPTLERILALNVTAPTLLAAAASKAFVARGAGAIINLASVLALAPEQVDGVYSGSKAYILNLTQAMAAQLSSKGLYVQAVLPGATRTEIWERSGKDVNAFPPEIVMEVADLVDAALVGFDRRETVTIPPLADETVWTAIDTARRAFAPVMSRRDVAPRYRDVAAAS